MDYEQGVDYTAKIAEQISSQNNLSYMDVIFNVASDAITKKTGSVGGK